METHFCIVSSRVFCSGSLAFLPRLAVGEAPLDSFLRFFAGGDDLGCGGGDDSCEDFSPAMRAEERLPDMMMSTAAL
jgi:hypothetical protein